MLYAMKNDKYARHIQHIYMLYGFIIVSVHFAVVLAVLDHFFLFLYQFLVDNKIMWGIIQRDTAQNDLYQRDESIQCFYFALVFAQ